jgi:hypothetical protein
MVVVISKKAFQWLFVVATLLMPALLLAQNPSIPVLERPITMAVNNKSVDEVLTTISEQTGVVFSYTPEIVSNRGRINMHVQQRTVRYALNYLFHGSVKYKVKGKYIILQKNNLAKEAPAKTRTVEGYVTEIKSGEKLSDVTVYGKDNLVSTITNQYGYFKLELPAEQTNVALRISKFGYANAFLLSSNGQEEYVDVELSSKLSDTLRTASMAPPDSDMTAHFDILHWLVSKNIWINTRNISDTIFRKVQFSFLPFISTNKLLTGNAENNLSFNVLAGYVQDVHTAEFGGIFNIVRHNAGMSQLAGVGNIVGRTSRGFQGAGILNYAQNVRGAQAAGVMNVALKDVSMGQFAGIMSVTGGTVFGVQASGVVNYSRNVDGVQLAGILNSVLNDSRSCQIAGVANFTGRASQGFQMAGIMNATRYLKGTQLAGVLNIALNDTKKPKTANDSVRRPQPAGIFEDTVNVAEAKFLDALHEVSQKAGVCQLAGVGNVFGGSIKGVQASGVFNYARNVSGLQITSMINIAHTVHGAQIALFNFSDSCQGTPIGLFSYVRHGYHSLELSADETFFTTSFRTGAKSFHNIFMIGGRPGNYDNPIWTYGFGVGTSIGRTNAKTLFDIDLISQSIVDGGNFDYDNKIYKLYLGFDRKIAPKASVAVGLTCNFFFLHKEDPDYSSLSAIIPYSFTNTSSGNGVNLKSWVGGRVAVRL